jgi:iron complex transport system ATP-binding protein
MLLKIENIEFSYQSTKILNNVAFNVRSREFLGIMGPNGSGKTTLLKCISDLLRPQIGTVLIDSKEIQKLSKKEIAKNIGVVPQTTSIDFAFTVRELVLMGRNPHIDRFRFETSYDFKIVEEAMKLTNVPHLANRTFDELSGGEKQRVIIARALAQEPKVLLLDEPTVHLDIGCQLEILSLVKKLCFEKDIIVLAVFHDLNLATRYSDNLLLLDEGKIVSIGKPEDVLTPENIQRAYHIDAIVKRHPLTNTLYVTPYESERKPSTRNVTVHVICGGGSGTYLMKILLDNGYNVTAGVLNVLDTDFEMAKHLGVTVIGEIPFSQITTASHQKNINLLKQANAAIITDFPVGPGNLKNIEAAAEAIALDIPVIFIDVTSIEQKDFTGGKLQNYFAEFRKKNVFFVKNVKEAIELLDKLSIA